MLQVPCNVSSTSSHTNFDYYQLMESACKKENISQLSEKSKRYILSKDIRKYEAELKEKQNAEQISIQVVNPPERQFLSVDQRQDKSDEINNNQLKLTSLNTKNKDIVITQKYLSPTDITKKLAYPINQPELRKNSSSNGFKLDKNEQNILQIKENIASIPGTNSTNVQVRKIIGPNLLQNNDPIKDKNIFLEQNNPINRTLYKEFNIGPRTDREVGSPQWYNRQKEMIERPIKQHRRSSQFNRDSFGRNEEDDRQRIKNRSVHNSKVGTENPQSSSFRQQISLTEKSFQMRPDTTQSVMKLQVQQVKKKQQKKNEQVIEVSKDQLIRELRDIERRHILVSQREQDIINQMRIDERNIFTRDERVLQRHQRRLSDWDNSRAPTDSCMLRGEQHRRKVEYAQAFNNLKSEDERFGKRLILLYSFIFIN